MILNPFFYYLENKKPEWFVDRSKSKAKDQKTVKSETIYHILSFIFLCLLSLFDPYHNFSIVLVPPPLEPPSFLMFLLETFFLVMLFETIITILHKIFHIQKTLYSKIHYVHHQDYDPTASSSTKIHFLEVVIVYLCMNTIPCYFLQPHVFCLAIAFMIVSIMFTLSHAGLKGVYICEYHRLHHIDPRKNMLSPILSILFG